MNYKKQLIKFMMGKAEVITKEGYDGELYFTEDDIQDFEVMSDEDAKRVWGILKDRILIQKRSGLDSSTCPWCIFRRIRDVDCNLCGYGIRHNRFNNYYESTICCDDYLRLIGQFKTLSHNFITNQVYRDIINNIIEVQDE